MVRIQSLFALSFSAVEFAASTQATWKVCETDADYKPKNSAATWQGANCEEMMMHYFPSGFTPDKETCAGEGQNDPDEPNKKFIFGEVLGSFAATCCGGDGKDACAKHAPFSTQVTWKVCEKDADYKPKNSAATWQGANCEEIIMVTFPSGFTPSKETCAGEGTDPQDPNKKFIVGQVLGSFAATCCGGDGNDACQKHAGSLFCKKEADFAIKEEVEHNNEPVLCRDVAFEIGLSVPPSEKLCAEKIDANGLEALRSKFMEDYKGKCCAGGDSICTEFHTSPSESDGNNSSTTDADETSGAFHVATLTVPAAMTLFISI